jgi:O-antigen/teichoic acid export membrane protein
LVAKTKLDDEAKYLALLGRIFRFFSLMGWGVFIFIVLFSGYLVPLLYGSQYEQAIQVLNIYALTNIAINMGIAQTLWLVNERKSIISSYKTISGAIFCIIGNLIFLPIFGIVGAALVALMSQVISAIISNAILDKKIFILQIRCIFFIPKFFTLRNS